MEKKNKHYFYDLHTHTEKSADAIGKIEEYIKTAQEIELTGFAVTDHNKVYDGKEEISGITIIPGSEITLKDGSHLLAYYIKKALPKRKLTLEEAVKIIKKQGGYSFLAHPTSIIHGHFKQGKGYFKIKNKKAKEIKVALDLVDGVEIGNASETKELRTSAQEISEKLSTKRVWIAGSDAHAPKFLGLGIVKTKERLTRENFLRVIKEGEMIVKTNFNLFKRVLYIIERLFLILSKVNLFWRPQPDSNRCYQDENLAS